MRCVSGESRPLPALNYPDEPCPFIKSGLLWEEEIPRFSFQDEEKRHKPPPLMPHGPTQRSSVVAQVVFGAPEPGKRAHAKFLNEKEGRCQQQGRAENIRAVGSVWLGQRTQPGRKHQRERIKTSSCPL